MLKATEKEQWLYLLNKIRKHKGDVDGLCYQLDRLERPVSYYWSTGHIDIYDGQEIFGDWRDHSLREGSRLRNPEVVPKMRKRLEDERLRLGQKKFSYYWNPNTGIRGARARWVMEQIASLGRGRGR